jgi:hypothetical protein
VSFVIFVILVPAAVGRLTVRQAFNIASTMAVCGVTLL